MGKIVNPTDQDPVFVAEVRKPIVEEGSLVSLNLIPEHIKEKENIVSIRSSAPAELLDTEEIDPEERAHMKNFPGYEVPIDCHEVSGDNDHILFPCPMDTHLDWVLMEKKQRYSWRDENVYHKELLSFAQ